MSVTYSGRLLATVALAAAAVFGAQASAATVYLQDYESPGNLDEPFHLQPDASGSTRGILDQAAPNSAGSSTTALDATSGALGSSQSAQLNIVDNPAAPGSLAGTTYTIRFIPNGSAGVSAANPAFATDGYVGFMLKLDPAYAAALLQVAPLLEDSGGTLAGSGGVLKDVIADGQWHRYQWNMDDPADFPNTFESFYGGTPAAETLDATASFDSIAIHGRGPEGSSVVLNIDQIGYNNTGQLVPEPTTLALSGLAGLMALMVGRKRAA